MSVSSWMDYEGVEIFHVGTSAYSYQTSHISLDADGCPRAYNPSNTGLDYNANAGYPSGGWRSVLVVDPNDNSRPYVQTSGPTAGFFVSKTSLTDPSLAETNPDKYVDSETFPYIVFPGAFYNMSGTGDWGDIVMARSLANGRESVALVADGGPTHAPLGEMSLNLAAALGGHNPNPKNGAGSPPGPIQYVVFPRSRANPPWRRSLADVAQQGRDLLAGIGGWPTI